MHSFIHPFDHSVHLLSEFFLSTSYVPNIISGQEFSIAKDRRDILHMKLIV